MKRLLLVLAILPLISYGQVGSVLPTLMTGSSQEEIFNSQQLIQELATELRTTEKKNDVARLKQVFNRTHKTFLKEYVTYSQFDEIFDGGKYDCLTATSLFALMLDEMGFSYRIVETNYHIFILVRTSKGEVLLETTDRFNGVVRNEKEIKRRLNTYRSGIANTEENSNVYRYQFELCGEVSLPQLPGLLYFNQAVKAYNAGKMEQCAELLVLAQAIYSTPRINEFGSIFLAAVMKSQLDGRTKQQIIQKISSGKITILASR